jgi:hypothetical protein
MEPIEAHFARYYGEPETVFHEILSDLVHIDVHVVPPAAGRDRWTLFTTGMSDLPMTTPEGAGDLAFAELVLFLPPEWRVDLIKATPPPDDLERWYWPIRWLKRLARFPHEYKTWLGFAHSIPNGDPPEPLGPDTKLSGWLLLSPIEVPEEASPIALEGRTVQIYALHALHAEEMAFKLDKGTGALLDVFDSQSVSEVLHPDRTSVV